MCALPVCSQLLMTSYSVHSKGICSLSGCVTAPLLELKWFVEAEERTPLPRHPSEMVNDALKLLGDAVASTPKIRRKRVMKACNPRPDVQDLAEEESLFEEDGSHLLGP